MGSASGKTVVPPATSGPAEAGISVYAAAELRTGCRLRSRQRLRIRDRVREPGTSRWLGKSEKQGWLSRQKILRCGSCSFFRACFTLIELLILSS